MPVEDESSSSQFELEDQLFLLEIRVEVKPLF